MTASKTLTERQRASAVRTLAASEMIPRSFMALPVAKRVVERGAILRIADPAMTFDGTDIAAEIMLAVLGLVGTIEKHFIKARQRRGIEAAKAKGIYKGRSATIRPEDVRKLHAEGLGATEIAKRLRIGRASVYRALAA